MIAGGFMEKYVSYRAVMTVLVAALVGILGFFGSSTCNRLSCIQNDICLVQIQLAELKIKVANLVTREQVIELIDREFDKRKGEHQSK